MKIEEIKRTVDSAVRLAFPKVEFAQCDIGLAPEGIADFATTVPFKLAKMLHKNPLQIAEQIKSHILPEYFSTVSVAKPGYLNFTLSDASIRAFLEELITEQEHYFHKPSKNEKIQIEFVSANPTGPLHIGNGRGGIIGDVLANILTLLGYSVQREYYVNDAGSKMDGFAKSIEFYYLKACGQESIFPDDGYRGKYIEDIAQDLFIKQGRELLNTEPESRFQFIRNFGKEKMIESIRKSLSMFGITFDSWFFESSLYEGNNSIEKAIELLKNSGHTYQTEGALWFKTTVFGDDKDRVIVRNNGEPTYVLGDVAYHINKWGRGFSKAIDVWGADHFGHIIPLKALLTGAGLPKDFLEVIIYQIVHLYENGEEIVMSKHTGSFVTLDELIEEVGKDAARFFFLQKSADTHLNFDLGLAKQKSMDNPVYYVQYTYARLNKILEEASLRNIRFAKNTAVELLSTPEERELIKRLIFITEELESIGADYSIHRLTFTTVELCQLINAFYQKHRVLNSEEYAQPRLALVKASLITLSMLFDLMGIEKKESM
ncbi:MAG: arginine--tRNA ligase [Caldisericaceae bacterium]